MKKCELCKSAAKIFCDSDQANLCWECDARVHSANFLVAKHSRTLLCQSCQSLTPWTGSGPRLGPTVSVCPSCFSSTNSNTSGPHQNGVEEDDDDDEDDESDHTEEDDEEEEDGDNQVVPLSASTASQQPPSTSNSSSENSSNSGFTSRTDENANSHYHGIERQRMRSWTWR